MYNQNSDLMKQEKFMLPTMIEGDFSAEELAEDADGLQMSFQRVKIAVEAAKAYVTTAIEHSLAIGKGCGPTHHFYELYQHGLSKE